MKSQRQNRSDKYQYLICEVNASDEFLQSFSNEESIEYTLNPFKYDEQILELQDRLRDRFWALAKEMMTERQWEVARLYVDGYTQMEIAKMLGVNQSSITKSLNGNTDYQNRKKTYGGLKKKMRKIASQDPEIQELLAKINELKEEKF